MIYSIYFLLNSFATNDVNKITNRYFRWRGKYLQEKTSEIFHRFFKNEAHIYNEYTTSINGDGQDILLLHKGLSLIIESKAGREAEPQKAPKDTLKVFEGIYRYFKRNIQEGYSQTFRIKKLFDKFIDFDIYDSNGIKVHHVKTRKYQNVFSLIVTIDKFRKPQIDLSLLLQLDHNDNRYPFSVCIDDLEVILLTMKRLKLGKEHFVKFLRFREQLQGRIECNDELELWSEFMNNKNFLVSKNEKDIFHTATQMTSFYDDLYEKGLGFKKEKNWEKKRSDKGLFVHPGKAMRNRSK